MVRWSKSGGIALTCSRSSRENDRFCASTSAQTNPVNDHRRRRSDTGSSERGRVLGVSPKSTMRIGGKLAATHQFACRLG